MAPKSDLDASVAAGAAVVAFGCELALKLNAVVPPKLNPDELGAVFEVPDNAVVVAMGCAGCALCPNKPVAAGCDVVELNENEGVTDLFKFKFDWLPKILEVDAPPKVVCPLPNKLLLGCWAIVVVAAAGAVVVAELKLKIEPPDEAGC